MAKSKTMYWLGNLLLFVSNLHYEFAEKEDLELEITSSEVFRTVSHGVTVLHFY